MTSSESEIIDLFPIKVGIDEINKDISWKCIPLVPNININRIKNAIKGIQLTHDENNRNKNLDNFIAFHNQ